MFAWDADDIIYPFAERSAGIVETALHEKPPSSNQAKGKMTKAERRALQESQRAAKAASRGGHFSYLNTIR